MMKIAVCATGDAAGDVQAVLAMLEAQGHGPSRVSVLETGSGGAAGVSAAGQDVSVFRHSGGESFVIVCGVAAGHGFTPLQRPGDDILADEERIRPWLCSLEGVFCAVWHHRSCGVWLLVSDPHGAYPLYVHDADRGLCAASEIRAVAAVRSDARRPDPAGMGALAAVGHMLGGATLLRGVTRFPAASLLRLDDHGRGRPQITGPYWQLPAVDTDIGVKRSAEAVAQALHAEAECLVRRFPEAAVMLSGGIDSRLQLALAVRHGAVPRAVIVSQPEHGAGAERRFARRVARQFGLQREEWSVGADFFSSSDYLDYMLASCTGTRSLNLFISGVLRAVPGGQQGVWDGLFAGNLIGGGAVTCTLDELKDRRCRGQDNPAWLACSALFRGDFFEAMMDGVYDAFDRFAREHGSGVDAAARYYALERMRHRTAVNPYMCCSGRNIPLSLGSGRQFWEAVFRLPASLRGGFALYRAVISRHFPEMDRHPYLCADQLLNMGRMDIQRLLCWAADRLPWRLAVAVGLRFEWRRSRYLSRALELAECLPDDVDMDAVQALRRRGIVSLVDMNMAEMLLYRLVLHWIAEDGARPGCYGGAEALLD
jgi:asparagine synthase (glutamine-hydrolysing)